MDDVSRRTPPLRLGESFASGARATLQSPLKTSALAMAGLAAAFSLVVAIGAVLLPWVLSSLSAHQLRQQRGGITVPLRARLWIVLVEALGLALFGGVAALCVVSWALPMPWSDPDPRIQAGLEALWRSPALLIAGALAAPLRSVWMWVPTRLFDGEKGPVRALEQTAQLVDHAPRSRALLLSALAPLLPSFAVALGIALVLLLGSADVRAYLAAAFVALVAVALVLARAWVTASYIALCPTPLVDDDGPGRESRSARGTAVLGYLAASAATALGPSLVVLSTLLPQLPAEGRMPVDAEPLVRLDATSNLGSAVVPGTTLVVYANPRRVAIAAGDGGGVGVIPLPEDSEISSVVVGQQAASDRYWLQITARGEAMRRVPFDADGVRLDEQLGARLDKTCPWPMRLALAFCVVFFGLSLGRVVRPSTPPRRARTALLASLSLVALAIGVLSLF